jgi:hypothetical protein
MSIDIDKIRINMDLEPLKPIIDEFNISENSQLWNYIYETFIKEREAKSFVASLKKSNPSIDVNLISEEDCWKHFMWLCGAYNQDDSNKDRED